MSHDVTDAIDVAGRIAIAAIDFHSTRIYAIDSPDHSRPEKVTASDPRGYFHNVYHRHGNPDGTYEDDSDEYWRAIASGLNAAAGVIVFGHGKGKANAGHHFIGYIEKHDRPLAAKILGEFRVDIDDITDEQLLRLGQQVAGIDPLRDHGDSRWGEN
jgi:hypothetical protein